MPQSATLLPTSSRVIAWPRASAVAPPFGSSLPNRAWRDVSRGYRYGFNGKEKDAEGMGGGSSTYDYGFRIYNPELCRFISTDPLYFDYSMLSLYQYASNTPIWAIDLDGLEAVVYTYGSTEQVGGKDSKGNPVDQHAMIAIYDDAEGLIVYTYGRYTDDVSISGSPGVLIKLTGSEAEAEIKHVLSKVDGKATYISKVDKEKIKSHYDNLLDKGEKIEITQVKSEPKWAEDGTNYKARIINKYNVFNGNICSGSVIEALEKGGFNTKRRLEKGDYSKKMKIWGIFKVSYSVQILQARLDKSIEYDNKRRAINDEFTLVPKDECEVLIGTQNVTEIEKKKSGSSIKPDSKSVITPTNEG